MTIMETEQATTVLPEIDTTEGTWLMDPSLKQRWVTALRSGKYQQGTGMFYNAREDSYCVLGVLCDVAGQPTRADDGKTDNWTFAANVVGSYKAIEPIWGANDDGTPFPELADYIEENL